MKKIKDPFKDKSVHINERLLSYLKETILEGSLLDLGCGPKMYSNPFKGICNKILTIELSQSGEKPATHYFCTMVVDQKKADKLMAKREFTIMEIAEPKDFLEKHNLKMIK